MLKINKIKFHEKLIFGFACYSVFITKKIPFDTIIFSHQDDHCHFAAAKKNKDNSNVFFIKLNEIKYEKKKSLNTNKHQLGPRWRQLYNEIRNQVSGTLFNMSSFLVENNRVV